MKGLDTNILLRFLLADDPTQARTASAFIDAHCTEQNPCVVNPVVLAELSWVLRAAYRLDRAAIADAVDQIANSRMLRISGVADIAKAIDEFRDGRADFSDCLLGVLNREAGCTVTATFDRKAAEMTDFEFVPYE